MNPQPNFSTPLLTFGFVIALMHASPFETVAEEGDPVSFTKTIRPILREKCTHCHNKKTLPERVSFESAKQAFVKSKGGLPIIVPGSPEKSYLMLSLTSARVHENAMPMVGPRPTVGEIESIRKWIREGADWPKGLRGRIRPTFYPTE